MLSNNYRIKLSQNLILIKLIKSRFQKCEINDFRTSTRLICNLFQKMFPSMRTVSGFLGTINSDISCTEPLASYESTTSLCLLDKLTMQLSHLPHVLLGISYTVLALISRNPSEVFMRSLGFGLLLSCSFPCGESRFGYAVRQTYLKTAIFDRNRTSCITTNLAIKYISILPAPSLVLT